jgi:hypothetical protein
MAREWQRTPLDGVSVNGEQRPATAERIAVRGTLSQAKDVAVGLPIALVGGSSATAGACTLWHDGSSELRRCVVML